MNVTKSLFLMLALISYGIVLGAADNRLQDSLIFYGEASNNLTTGRTTDPTTDPTGKDIFFETDSKFYSEEIGGMGYTDWRKKEGSKTFGPCVINPQTGLQRPIPLDAGSDTAVLCVNTPAFFSKRVGDLVGLTRTQEINNFGLRIAMMIKYGQIDPKKHKLSYNITTNTFRVLTFSPQTHTLHYNPDKKEYTIKNK